MTNHTKFLSKISQPPASFVFFPFVCFVFFHWSILSRLRNVKPDSVSMLNLVFHLTHWPVVEKGQWTQQNFALLVTFNRLRVKLLNIYWTLTQSMQQCKILTPKRKCRMPLAHIQQPASGSHKSLLSPLSSLIWNLRNTQLNELKDFETESPYVRDITCTGEARERGIRNRCMCLCVSAPVLSL